MSESSGERPFVICHMLQSADGKCTGSWLMDSRCAQASDAYYRIHREFNADAFACGRVTMEGSFTHGWKPDLSKYRDPVDRSDHIVAHQNSFYAVCFDRRGRLGWKDDQIHDEDPGYDHAYIIEVLCEDLVSNAYLAYLQEQGISYVFGGKKDLDLNLVLGKLHDFFGIETLLLEGGPALNASFAREELIDQLSLVTVDMQADEGEPVLGSAGMNGFRFMDRIPLEEGVYVLQGQHFASQEINN